MQASLVAIGLLACFPAWAELPFVNFENHPVHALDLSPDQRTVAISHTADQRVQFMDVSSSEPILIGSVLVGVDPVSVRFRSDTEIWVVNHVSDSISIIDPQSRQIKRTLATADEPYDVVFAAGKAFVSCSQANRVQVFELDNLSANPVNLEIKGEDPRALALSPDGRFVYAAIFESGNASTVLQGGIARNGESVLANVVSDTRGPYGGQNPPPNRGTIFFPAVNPQTTPPKVSLIVKRDAEGRWRDDNNGDWSRFVSGDLASLTGRVQGWTVLDHDIAVINTQSLELSYVTGLMNTVAAIAVKSSGELTAVGTEATNQIRFEPNLNGRFIRAQLARISTLGVKTLSDLNPHLDYLVPRVAQAQRTQAIGDPRALVWNADGTRAYVVGMGSNNVIVIGANGERIGDPIRVGEGPTAIQLDAARSRLYVWNHFEASLSVVSLQNLSEQSRTKVFNPLPEAIKAGRAMFYNTQLTSGLGQASCASCHVDGRMDKLAWDLGDPSQAPSAFDQNCVTVRVGACQAFHAMKGPMTTQTMQDIIGHEPLHWRGDRRGIEAFNPAFVDLLGDDQPLTTSQMRAFKDFLRTLSFPPNPYRKPDNSLPTDLALKGQHTSGRFSMRGLPLPNGNAVRGLDLYVNQFLDSAFRCASCHTLPTGMAVNGSVLASILNFPLGNGSMPMGPEGENHLGIVSTDGFTNVSMKVPQTRNMHEKVGAEFSQRESLSGFGFAHDGSVGSMADFFSANLFSVTSDQDVADLVALNMAFAGSDFPISNPALSAPAPTSLDAHAGVGLQTDVNGSPAELSQLQLAQARLGKLDLIVATNQSNYAFDRVSDRFLPADGAAGINLASLLAFGRQTWTSVSPGLAKRLALDRDGDGVFDQAELLQGSNPADAASKTTRALAGMWYNPARSGHGFDVQYVGEVMFITWFTYDNDSKPTWYTAVATPIIATGVQRFNAPMTRFVWNKQSNQPEGSVVGELEFSFTRKDQGSVRWRIGNSTGTEAIVPLIQQANVIKNRTGNWYNPAESGWGLGMYTQGEVNFTLMYFYEGNGQPVWVVGTAPEGDHVEFQMQSLRGPCPSCTYLAPTLAPAGSLTLDFTALRALRISCDVSANTSTERFIRGPLMLTPLSSPVSNFQWQ